LSRGHPPRPDKAGILAIESYQSTRSGTRPRSQDSNLDVVGGQHLVLYSFSGDFISRPQRLETGQAPTPDLNHACQCLALAQGGCGTLQLARYIKLMTSSGGRRQNRWVACFACLCDLPNGQILGSDGCVLCFLLQEFNLYDGRWPQAARRRREYHLCCSGLVVVELLELVERRATTPTNAWSRVAPGPRMRLPLLEAQLP
jgi:hypothetical protein